MIGHAPVELMSGVVGRWHFFGRRQVGQLNGGVVQQLLHPFGLVTAVGQGIGKRQHLSQRSIGPIREHQCTQRLDANERRCQCTPCGRTVVRRACKFTARLCGGQQMSTQVAAVHGGHIHRQQRRLALRVVPIQEMAPVARQFVQRFQRGFKAGNQVFGIDPAKLASARDAQQVQADVGGRCAVGHHRLRGDLQVVGRQVVVFGADTTLEQAPGVARHAFKVRLVLRRQGSIPTRRTRPADPPCPYRRHRPDRAQQQGQTHE